MNGVLADARAGFCAKLVILTLFEAGYLKAGVDANSIGKEQWVQENVLRFLMQNALSSIIPSLIVVLIFSWVNWSQLKVSVGADIWLASALLLGGVRLFHYYRYVQPDNGLTIRHWLVSYRILALFSGLVYGFMTVLFFKNASTPLQVLNMFIVVGMPAAAVGTHAVDRYTFRLFMLAIITPSAVVLYLTGDPTYRVVAFLIAIFTFVMDRSARQSATSIRDNFNMTFEMSYRATHDPLVGLFNREELEHQFELRAPRSKKAIAMMFVDLDNFKPLNDTLGHQAGDDALIKVADIIKHAIRSDDIAARLGGDEFCVILFIHDETDVMAIANRICEDVANLKFPEQYGGLSTSIGVSYNTQTQVSFSRLMRVADMACYESKEAGRNQVTLLQYGVDA